MGHWGAGEGYKFDAGDSGVWLCRDGCGGLQNLSQACQVILRKEGRSDFSDLACLGDQAEVLRSSRENVGNGMEGGVAKVIGRSTMGMICTAGGQILVPDFIAWSWSGGTTHSPTPSPA